MPFTDHPSSWKTLPGLVVCFAACAGDSSAGSGWLPVIDTSRDSGGAFVDASLIADSAGGEVPPVDAGPEGGSGADALSGADARSAADATDGRPVVDASDAGNVDSGVGNINIVCNVGNAPPTTVTIACVGDSITFGYNASAPSKSYPSQLGVLLGSGYQVGNFGVSGTTMLKNGSDPYWGHPELGSAEGSSPNVVVIGLGTNDINSQSFPNLANFRGDYASMISLFRGLSSHPSVFSIIPIWVKTDDPSSGYTEARLQQLIPLVQQAASANGACLIDLHSVTSGHPELYSDNIHPNDSGYLVMAKAVCAAIIKGCP